MAYSRKVMPRRHDLMHHPLLTSDRDVCQLITKGMLTGISCIFKFLLYKDNLLLVSIVNCTLVHVLASY